MSARARDVIGIVILLVAGIAIRIAWHPLGPWVSLAIAIAAAIAVMAVYRLRRQRSARRADSDAAESRPTLHRSGTGRTR
jgi:membrane protein implicated in regulation of membrane protease activity